MGELEGDLLVLGAGGKMGPSLLRLAHRASREAGSRRRIIAVSRFGTPGLAAQLAADGIETVERDLLDPGVVDDLPDAPHVVFMAGQKFGTSENPSATWALNAFLPGLMARRYATSNLVVFSTGNVYPFTSVGRSGSVETDPVGPIGEYAQSAVAREHIVTWISERQKTPSAILRLNYAVELRYGVLRDLADRVWRSAPIDLTMGHVNVIWQRDANAIALGSLQHCAVPPAVFNVTGPTTLSVRDLAEHLARRLGVEPVFTGREAASALLSDASRCVDLFGSPTLDVDTLLDWVADWVQLGGRSFDRPTHFEERGGRF
ncbi:MAG: NAD-dependent epimerase/dehydratase family protein [Gemmatimonadota bacterium]|nr:NAD-dependent epimerase/dehydratase family protein [Gemmatimonadota bacterium]MDH3369056.1 NAD-dependent epimerase/dehydratase family protein [Gemmatimonadota bacterium]MDH3479433.1 NAD-dependent epimerase/dehydratase family protein [Gemmatimonadota bacterium]MDH5550047.1 NAD-dependent epimerase/dehydratase family protein [Gemmatimonadota bacterium]